MFGRKKHSLFRLHVDEKYFLIRVFAFFTLHFSSAFHFFKFSVPNRVNVSPTWTLFCINEIHVKVAKSVEILIPFRWFDFFCCCWHFLMLVYRVIILLEYFGYDFLFCMCLRNVLVSPYGSSGHWTPFCKNYLSRTTKTSGYNFCFLIDICCEFENIESGVS